MVVNIGQKACSRCNAREKRAIPTCNVLHILRFVGWGTNISIRVSTLGSVNTHTHTRPGTVPQPEGTGTVPGL